MANIISWLTSFITKSPTTAAKAGGGIIVSLLFMFLSSALLYSCESGKTEAQAQEITNLAAEVSELTTERDLLKTNNRGLVEQRAKDMQRLTVLAIRSDKRAALVSTLQHQLMEALNRESPATRTTVFSADVTDNICMQWLTANGYLSADGHGAGTAGPLQGDTPAAFCQRWHGRLTVEVALKWAGLLLEYAGTDVDYNATRREARAEQKEADNLGKSD